MSVTSGFQGLRVAAFESRMAAEMTRLISRYGGDPLVAPALREIPLEDNRAVLQFGEHLFAGRLDMVILLTGVGTRTMIEVLQTRHALDTITSALAQVSLVARGPKPVAVLKELGLSPQILVPEPNTWRDILQALDARTALTSLRIAVQEYGVSNRELLEGLRQRGAEVTPVPVYRWALPEDIGPLREVLESLLAGRVDVMLITNAAQVDHLLLVLDETQQVAAFRQALQRVVVASVGPTASERLRSHGLPVDLEPSHPKMGMLVKETSEQAQALLHQKRGTRNAE
jgi:uroporphyrinogen-III synthase